MTMLMIASLPLNAKLYQMKKKLEEEEAFFSQVEEVLQTHEDAYDVGAWEEFVATRKKEKRKWPLYAWTAAAVVLLLLSFGLFELTKKDELHNDAIVVKNENKQPESGKLNDNPTPKADEGSVIETKTITYASHNNPILAVDTDVNSIITKSDLLTANEKPNNSNIAIAAAVTPKDTAITRPVFINGSKNTVVLAGAYDSLLNRNQVAKIDERNDKKLTYSLVVSPALSNQKLNFGAGMELSYKLGDHLSVSSGLMYTAINAKSDGNSLTASNNSRAQNANLAVAGIELPLGIQYHTKGGFYAAAGVSALGLINDKLEYSFLAERTVSEVQYSAGIANDVLKVVNEKQTEKSIEPLNNYMGFFNFSAGKKQAFGNVNLNIGPFVKVPFSSVSSEKIKLLQGGVKVSIDF